MNPNSYVNNAVFWIEIEKVHPNPYQPRREFDQAKLKDLGESIRMYGVLQPLVVTRKEVYHEQGVRAHLRRAPLARFQAGRVGSGSRAHSHRRR